MSINSFPTALCDTDLLQVVSRFLASQQFPALRNFKIDVEHGAVTLSGKVRSYHEKQIAIASCQRLNGVLSLVDQIEVVD